MSHLLRPSIRPRLGRSRSHTSPSPTRPSDLENTDVASTHANQQRNVTYGDSIPTPSPSGRVVENAGQESRPSVESSRRSKVPHIHIHPHLPSPPSHHHSQKQAPATTSSTSDNVKSLSKPLPITEARPGPFGKQNVISSSGSTAPATPREQGSRDTLSLSSATHGKQDLRRSLSNRSSSRYNAQTDFSIGSHLLPPIALSTSSHGIRGSSPNRSQRRPRATSDQSRPALGREPTLSSAATPEAVSSAVSMAIERGDRRRQDKLASVTPAEIERLNREATEADIEMRTRLDGVTKEGLEMTRRLDYTYYNLLERIGYLASMVGQFQSLGNQVVHLGQRLEHDMRGLDHETKDSIKVLREAAEGRSEKVTTLEARMKTGRDRARALGERLEIARNRLADFDKREEEWRKSTRRKIKIAWVLSGLLIFLISAFLGMKANHANQKRIGDDWMEGIQQIRPGTKSLASTSPNESANEHPLASQLEQRAQSVYIPKDVIEMLTASTSTADSRRQDHHRSLEQSEEPHRNAEVGIDIRLRVFDEL